jgi:hypothetical protein
MVRKRALCAVVIGLALTGCATTDEISKFASNASAALEQGQAVVKDWKQSCVREHLAEAPFDEFDSQQAQAEQACKSSIGVETDQLAISRVLEAYFTALSQLAAGTASTARVHDAPEALADATSPGPQYKKILDFVSRSFTKVYTQKKLAEDVKAADEAIGALTDAQAAVIQKEYSKQLNSEQEALRQRYTSFLGHVKRTPELKSAEPVVTVLFQDHWDSDVKRLEAKRAAAAAFVEALHKVGDAHHALALKGDRFTAEEMRGLLGPYIADIQYALAMLRKAF